MPGRVLLIACALALTGAAPTAAQEYRENMPEVWGPSADEAAPEPDESRAGPDAGAIAREFRRAYAAADAPRLAVYWNRSFSARLSQWVAQGRLRVSQTGSAAADIRTPEGRHSADVRTERAGTAALERNAGQDRRRAGMGTLADAEFEAGFTDPMLDAGAQLVDRATIMRVTDSTTGRGAGTQRLDDVQLVETEALKEFADYVVEVTMLPDAAAPGDKAFRVQVKRIPDGLIVANLVTRGRRPAGPPDATWRATSGGYEKEVVTPTVSAAEIGRHVALETMSALAARWP
jgi:hypothetical protein